MSYSAYQVYPIGFSAKELVEHLVLSYMKNRLFGTCLTAMHMILISHTHRHRVEEARCDVVVADDVVELPELVAAERSVGDV
jgi:hypothetical protein